MFMHNLMFKRHFPVSVITINEQDSYSIANKLEVPAIAFYYWGFKNSRGAQWGICIDCNPNNRTFIQIDGDDPTYNGDGRPVGAVCS
jgi:hypothetical protein